MWLTHDTSLAKEGQYYPLVSKAKVSGPWSVLAPNLVFVDLPGTGDDNAVRNDIAQREFKRADFVCVCARVDRAVTDKASLQWLDKSLRDMPSDNVAYVVTKCDDVSADEIRRDHGMRRGSCSKAAEKRNELIKKQLSAKSVQVFTVSSRDYARCIGLEDGVPAAFLTEEATQIPAVRKHIVDSMKSRKIKAIHTSLERFGVHAGAPKKSTTNCLLFSHPNLFIPFTVLQPFRFYRTTFAILCHSFSPPSQRESPTSFWTIPQ